MSSITVCRTHYPSKIFLATGSPYHVYYFHRVFSINTLNPWWDNDIIVIIFGIDTLSVYSYLVPRRGALLGFFNQAQQLLLMSAVRCYKCNGSSIEVFGLLLQKVSTQFQWTNDAGHFRTQRSSSELSAWVFKMHDMEIFSTVTFRAYLRDFIY